MEQIDRPMCMMQCDRCGANAIQLRRHRAVGVSMTHRRTRWLCRDCHPNSAAEYGYVRGPTAGGSDETAIPDGGTDTTTCPDCSTALVNVQGVYSCDECRWIARY